MVEGTTNIRVSIKSLLTGADWVMIDKATLRIVAAEARTHRNTLSLESVAVLIFWTVRIDGALFEAVSFRWIANRSVNVRIFDTFTVFASKSWETVASAAAFTSRDINASGLVVGHLTILCCSTLTKPTRVDTLLVLARLLGGTFAAASAPNTLDATIVSISGETRGTEFTDSFVVLHNTGGVSGTGGAFTGVLALVANTCLASRTSSVF